MKRKKRTMKRELAVSCSLMALFVSAGLCLGKGATKPGSASVGFDLSKDWSYTVIHKAGKDTVTVVEAYPQAAARRKPGESYPLTSYRVYRLSDAGNPYCPTCGIVLCK